MTYYAYIHARPDTTDISGVFYVGKGAGRRFRPSIRRTKHHTHVVGKYGAENILVGKVDCSSEEIAHELERGLIKCLRRNGVNLVNLTDGGEGSSGYVPSPESKAKIAEASKARWSDPEYRAKLSEVQKIAQSDPSLFTEKKRVASLRNAETARAALQNPEIKELARRKNSEKSKALWSNPQYKRTMQEKHVALWDEDRRGKMSAQTKGRIRMNNGTSERNVLPEQVEELLSNGWVKGRKLKANSERN